MIIERVGIVFQNLRIFLNYEQGVGEFRNSIRAFADTGPSAKVLKLQLSERSE